MADGLRRGNGYSINVNMERLETLEIARDGAVLCVTVNRPEALNALTTRVVGDLDQFADALAAQLKNDDGARPTGNGPVRGIIITGAGDRAFVAGADIREMAGMDPGQAHEYSSRMQSVTLKLETLPVPVIAAVNGHALGGGCELAMACDFIYASSNASFGQPEVSLGLVPGFGGSVRLQQRVGIGNARELLYTGRRISANEALRIGLVNAVFDSPEALLEAARQTIAEIAAQSSTAVALVKRTITEAAGRPTPEGLEIEAASFRQAFTTEDMRRGTRAFLAKEKPDFSGR